MTAHGRRWQRLLVAAFLLLGCALPALAADMIAIRGELTYKARIALPADSTALVELRDIAAAKGTPAVAEMRIPLQGRQVPVAFVLNVDRARLVPGRRYGVAGMILVAGKTEWTSDAVAVDVLGAGRDVGTVMLHQNKGKTVAAAYRCGDRNVSVDHAANGLLVTVGRERFEMRPVPSAVETRYEAVGDASTSLVPKGHGAVLTVHGRRYQPCAAISAHGAAFRARGSAPFWAIEIGDGKAKLTLPSPAEPFEGVLAPVETVGTARRFTATSGARTLTVDVVDKICVDMMSGLSFPSQVTASIDGRSLGGCGGDPAALLQGPEWRIATLNGARPLDRTAPTVKFEGDGRVVGQGPCNSFVGRYALTGDGVTISGIASTLKGCADPVAAQEKAYFATLQAVRTFEFAADGSLSLRTSDKRAITARR